MEISAALWALWLGKDFTFLRVGGGFVVYSGVQQSVAADQKEQMTQQQAPAAAAPADDDVSVVIDSQTSYRAAGVSSGTVGVDDTVSDCEMLSMSDCPPAVDIEPAMPSDTDHAQNCNSGGTLHGALPR